MLLLTHGNPIVDIQINGWVQNCDNFIGNALELYDILAPSHQYYESSMREISEFQLICYQNLKSNTSVEHASAFITLLYIAFWHLHGLCQKWYVVFNCLSSILSVPTKPWTDLLWSVSLMTNSVALHNPHSDGKSGQLLRKTSCILYYLSKYEGVRIIVGRWGQYHSCWWPGDMHHQVISTNDIDIR